MNTVKLSSSPLSLDPARLSSNKYATAMASGDTRFNAKQYDRPGMSRGAGQWNQAGIDAAQKMAAGIADAYTQKLQDQQYNANAALSDQQQREQYSQQLGALQQQNNYASRMAALQRQGAVMNLLGGLMR